MCYLINLTNDMEVTYHNTNTVILFEQRPLQACNSIFDFVTSRFVIKDYIILTKQFMIDVLYQSLHLLRAPFP